MTISRLPVFDACERTDSSPASHEESSFAFLNRAAGDFWEHPRNLIEEWCAHLPDEAEFSDIRSRLRSRDNGQFNSAFLELYLHETLLRTGHTVTIHPTLPHSTRRPDFYAEKDGAGFYLEAIAPGPRKAADAISNRRNRLIDVVNKLDDPNFFLWMHSLEVGNASPPAARLRTALTRWLRELDPDAITDYSDAPHFRWEHADWVAEFSAVPVSAGARGRDRAHKRAIGVDAAQPAEWVDDATTITKALTSKSGEYGNLDKPFIVAVGLYIFDTDRWHGTNAFFGHEQIIWAEDAETRAFRQGDGYFGTPPQWRNTNVSGVLVVNQLQPYHVHKADVALWIHPGADHLLPALGWPSDTVTLTGNHLETTPATVSASELFELQEPWPPGDPWPKDDIS